MIDHTPPPVDMGADSINVHLSYIRRDIDTLNTKLDKLTGVYVTQVDFAEHQKADEDHEARLRGLEKDRFDLKEEILTLRTQLKTWGSVAGAVLAVLQVIQILYSFAHQGI